MAAHYVICKFCNQRFNRDKEDAVAVEGRRYVHKTCYDEYIQSKGQEEQDYIELENYIKKIFKYTDIKKCPLCISVLLIIIH